MPGRGNGAGGGGRRVAGVAVDDWGRVAEATPEEAERRAALAQAMIEADEAPVVAEISPVARLTRDLANAAATMGRQEVRYIVDSYYQVQRHRLVSEGQKRALGKTGEPNEVVGWAASTWWTMEQDLKRALDVYSMSTPEGRWARSITGIGPVTAAALGTYVDLDHATSYSHVYKFAGLAPGVVWERGQKRPWCADFKVVCWKIGQSFVHHSGRESCFYGRLYRQRKAYEVANNEAGRYAEQAAEALARKNYHAPTIARTYYERGQLPPAHIQARAERWTVKLFLSHYWMVAYDVRHGVGSHPAPYPVAYLDHHDVVPIPNWPTPEMAA